METTEVRKGAVFLIEETPSSGVFTPEDFSDELKMMSNTARSFVKNEVQPKLEAIEKLDFELSRKLMLKAGEIGLLAAGIEEQYGGTGKDTLAQLLISTDLAGAGSFTLTAMCHLGIGMLPLVYFGTKEQKDKYLAKQATGEMIGAYALTEPLSGSDALSLRTKAKLSDDGKYYILNGEKQFITNAGFADVFYTYARVNDRVTAFIVEPGFEGVSTGAEESKMGYKGSSTRSLILEDAKVPVESVLFEIGRGHIVALNILNIGRLKLAGICLGESKFGLKQAVTYAKGREQFGQPICNFGMIKHKLAEMAVRIYIGESIYWRTSGLLDAALARVDNDAADNGSQNAAALAEYATECSVNKVYLSELLNFVLDEAIQIHGGYGYITEYDVESWYRNSRINRIYEGTNEINRVTMLDSVMRKAAKEGFPLFDKAKDLNAQLPEIESVYPSLQDAPLEYQRKLVEMARKIFILMAGAVVEEHGTKLSGEQELLGYLSEIIMQVFTMESGLIRALKSIESTGEEASKEKILMSSVYVNDAMKKVEDCASQILAALETGDVLDIQLAALRKLASMTPMNTVEARRAIAERIIEAEQYVC